ncbi:MAG TPA: hypothetical protein VMD56_03695 [Steroidobacteraceae bacterium]|nr:hypothetical protein [Steroidobacteraceae bacterium]
MKALALLPRPPMAVSLEHFEQLAYGGRCGPAIEQLLQLLRSLDEHSGRLAPALTVSSAAPLIAASDQRVTRLTAALTALATDPGFTLSPADYRALLEHHGWLGALFAASGFGNADHILRALSVDGGGGAQLHIAAKHLPVFCLFYSVESGIPLDIERLWATQPRLAAGLFISLLAAPFLATPAAYAKQRQLLDWLAQHLGEVADLDLLPATVLYRAYMRCSYADFADKHAIKRPINELIRAKLRRHGLLDVVRRCEPHANGASPTVLVVLEWFNEAHSIYRTHSLAIEGLRKRFRVVGMGYPEIIDAAGRAVFHEFHALDPAAGVLQNLEQIRAVSSAEAAQILYMPSVGMSTLTMFLANVRLAPRTVIGLGHPATTHSASVDRVAVESDYVGDPACFSEQLLRLPSDGQPYRPRPVPTLQTAANLQVSARDAPQGSVQIAVVATWMKINPRFLTACAQILQRSSAPVRLHFLCGNLAGLTEVPLRRLLGQYLGERATAHARLPYAEYLQLLARCDLFIDPFPFGNTNGIVDTVRAGLIGVCRTGPEVHEHIDEALFRRLGFPEFLITRSDAEYVTTVCRLVDDAQERQRLRERLAGPAAVAALSGGNPEALADRLHAYWRGELAPAPT